MRVKGKNCSCLFLPACCDLLLKKRGKKGKEENLIVKSFCRGKSAIAHSSLFLLASCCAKIGRGPREGGWCPFFRKQGGVPTPSSRKELSAFVLARYVGWVRLWSYMNKRRARNQIEENGIPGFTQFLKSKFKLSN